MHTIERQDTLYSVSVYKYATSGNLQSAVCFCHIGTYQMFLTGSEVTTWLGVNTYDLLGVIRVDRLLLPSPSL